MKRIFVGICALMISAMPVLAADNGCAKEENDRINPALALCSTHVYNIRQTQNQTGVNKQAMRDVVALKTTVMTQQMNKQYEYLEAMIRRFKTQLEKAVLTTGLEAKGASTSSGSGSASTSVRSDDKYVVLAGTENCMQKGSVDAAVTCTQSNVRIVMNALNAGNTNDARKQLEKDLDVAKSWGIVGYDNEKKQWVQMDASGNNTTNVMSNCTNATKVNGDRKKATVLACANELNVQIGLFLDNRSRQYKRQEK